MPRISSVLSGATLTLVLSGLTLPAQSFDFETVPLDRLSAGNFGSALPYPIMSDGLTASVLALALSGDATGVFVTTDGLLGDLASGPTLNGRVLTVEAESPEPRALLRISFSEPRTNIGLDIGGLNLGYELRAFNGSTQVGSAAAVGRVITTELSPGHPAQAFLGRLSFSGPAFTSVTIGPSTSTTVGLDHTFMIDDLTVAVVPEPSTMLLTAVGLLATLGVGLQRRRHTKNPVASQ